MLSNEWEVDRIKNHATKVGSGVTPRGGSSTYKDHGVPFIRSQNVLWGKLSFEDIAYIDDKQHAVMSNSCVQKNDVLLNITGASIGRSCIYENIDHEANVNQHVCIIRTNDTLAPKFLLYFLLSHNGQKQIEQFQAGGNRQGLNYEQIRSFKVPIPPVNEQNKIARILTTWDKAIETIEGLIKNSQQQKKYLMQQLLTGDQGLPNFNSNWKDWHLTDIADVIVSPVDKKTQPEEILVRLCNYTDVYYNTRITKNIDFMQATAKQSEIDRYTLKVDDVVITKDSETPGDIAIPALISEDLAGVVCGYHLAIIRPDKEIADGAYLNYLFSMPRIRYYFFTLATGATRFGLSIGGIKKAHFSLPPLKEQKKIASILSSADQEIESMQEKLKLFKQEKKALMQQLLTGKRRVKAA